MSQSNAVEGWSLMTVSPQEPMEERESARRAYLASVAMGKPLTRQELGERFGKSPSWGRDRIAEAKNGSGNDSDISDGKGDIGLITELDMAYQRAKNYADVPLFAVPDIASDELVVAEDATVKMTAATDDVIKITGDNTCVSDDKANDTKSKKDELLNLALAWLGFGFGAAVSIAGNVLFAWLPAAEMGEGWSPGWPVQAGAAVWPIALVIAVEVLSRISWPKNFLWFLIRFVGVGLVALAAAIISYGHIHDVLLAWGYDEKSAALGPLAIDGLMLVSGFALLALKTQAQKA